jgi:alpha-galactosidase
MGQRPLKFALDVAMSGALGLDLDAGKLSPGDRKLVANAVALYKDRIREVTLRGDLYRLESPYAGPRSALDFVSEDRTKAVLFVYQLKNSQGVPLRPRGLDPQRRYKVREINLPAGTDFRLAAQNSILEGASLMADGLQPPIDSEFSSCVIELVPEEETK